MVSMKGPLAMNGRGVCGYVSRCSGVFGGITLIFLICLEATNTLLINDYVMNFKASTLGKENVCDTINSSNLSFFVILSKILLYCFENKKKRMEKKLSSTIKAQAPEHAPLNAHLLPSVTQSTSCSL